MKIIAIIIFLFLIVNYTYALEIGSNAFTVDSINILGGGGTSLSSANYTANYMVLGEGAGSGSELSSTKFGTEAAHLFVILAAPFEEKLRWVISDLTARTEILGEIIPQGSWQIDNDPYFSWNIITEPTSLVKGFSVSLDEEPDLTIDTEDTSYQFPDDALLSGKHTFYVLPFTSEGTAVQESLLKFEIWVDVDLPAINQLLPPAGQILKDNLIAVSCIASDAHSGVDLQTTTFTLNNQAVTATYDAEKQSLEFRPASPLPEGKNTVLVKAYDAVGNYVLKGWDFIIDTQPPTGGILLNGGEEVTRSAYVFINIQASDLISGIKNIYISNDGVFDTELNHPYAYAPVIENWLVSEPDMDGTKTVFVKFEDISGNLSADYQDDIALRRMTPDTRIISGPPSVTEANIADFRYEAAKPGCLFSFKLDDADWSAWSDSSGVQFSALSQGNHYFYVKSGLDLNSDENITIDEEDSTPSQWIWNIAPEGYFEKLKERILFWRR